jgi:redox-sensitive bicupin YhaK (pirin superfamily)
MTAGSGIIHSEGPSADFAREGGEMELIQLWVNLPRSQKMTTPKYQDIKKESIPLLQQNGFDLHLVAGEYKDIKGPASTFTPILAMMVEFHDGGATEIEIPESFNALAYMLEGKVETGGVVLETHNLGVFDKNGTGVQLKALSKGKLLLLAGEPIKEPVVSYGPFVMNYPGEIKQAIMDYETGKMGVLES